MRRSEILPLPTASWIGWCTRLTASSCKENRCEKSEAAKMPRNDKSEESCGNGGAVESVESQNQASPSFHRVLLCSKTERKPGGLRPPPCAAALRACRVRGWPRTMMSVVVEGNKRKLLTDVDHCSTLIEPCVASLRTDRHQIGLNDRLRRNAQIGCLVAVLMKRGL